MRILDYAIAWIVEGIFFLALASLIGFGLAQMISRKPKPRNVLYRVDGPRSTHARTTSATYVDQWRSTPDRQAGYRQPRFGWLEELRAKHHMNNLDRLARKIERKLERRWMGWPWDLG